MRRHPVPPPSGPPSRRRILEAVAIGALGVGAAAVAWAGEPLTEHGRGKGGGGDAKASHRPLPAPERVPDGPTPGAPRPPFEGTTQRIRTPSAGRYFGISAYESPWSTRETWEIAVAAGQRPNMLGFFVKWTEEFRPKAVESSYAQGAVPMITWEPWAGGEMFTSAATRQPKYALARIIAGDHDDYIRRFAAGVRDQGRPVVLRFAHEMNGDWFPWSEQVNGNREGEYVLAWRHVHNLFRAAGASNVVWHWSPNIERGTSRPSLGALYPGRDYVDWLGVTGYALGETSAADVFDDTLRRLRRITDLPLLIGETGAKPGDGKSRWISSFYGWLKAHPDVVGFVWFERDKKHGGSEDWRFAADGPSRTAFRDGLADLPLAEVPVELMPNRAAG